MKTDKINSCRKELRIPFLDFLEEGYIIDQIQKHGKNVIYGVAATVLCVLTLYYFTSSKTSEKEEDYLKAAYDFTLFIKATGTSDTATAQAFSELTKLMQRHPELNAIYAAPIAQDLLNQSKYEEAHPFAITSLDRTKVNNLTFYQDFAATTLLISAGQHQEALNQSLTLQQQMSDFIQVEPEAKNRPFGDELFALNLFRIAMLNQELGNDQKEMESWQSWKRYAGLTKGELPLPIKISSNAFRSLIQQLAIGGIALPDYIAHRENFRKKSIN